VTRDTISDSDAISIIPDPLDKPCGWCGREAWLRLRAGVQTGWISFSYSSHDERPVIAGLYDCSGCLRPSLALFQAYWVSGWSTSLLQVIPATQAHPMGLPNKEVETDRVEAWACHYAGQHRAAVLMSRSALQRAVRLLDPFRGTLKAELDNLAEKGVITRQLRANADEVRLSGNDVAHPEDLGAVTESDAEDSLTFLDDFLETTIMIPERQRQREKGRQGGPTDDKRPPETRP
jgi:Domain of unknown function (DUF4145)